MPDETLKISLQDATKQLQSIPEKFIVLFQRGNFSAELYIPGEVDLQQPHQQDEIYIVAEGSGTFLRGEERVPFNRGDFLFVPAGIIHRFEQFTEDFKTWVFFFGPKGGSAQKP